MSRIAASAMVLAAAFTAGCGESMPAVDFELVQDRNLNSPEDVVGRVGTLLVVVDSPSGLYPPGSERTAGNVQIENADGDPELEVVVAMDVDGELPSIRLRQGSLPDVSLDVRFSGLGIDATPGARSVAEGRVQAIDLDRPPLSLPVPFNLRPELLPPRVTEVLPPDGGAMPDCDMPVVYVMFSKPVDLASLLADGAVRFEPGGRPREIRVDPSGLVAQLVPNGLTPVGETFSYRVVVESSVLDRSGNPLDQVPADPGAQPFAGDFNVTCSRTAAVPMDSLCGSADPPGALPETCGFERLDCVEGACVAAGCGDAECPDAYVCMNETGICEPDCRRYGDAEICPDDRPICDQASGACI